MNVRFEWRASPLKRIAERAKRQQKTMDSEILRGCEPYISKRSETLIKSGVIHTVIGSGQVKWKTPYARKVYYLTGKIGHNGGLRGKLWFTRWKADKGQALIKKVQNVQ